MTYIHRHRPDRCDREAAEHKAMVERIRNGVFPDDPAPLARVESIQSLLGESPDYQVLAPAPTTVAA